jgi:hypothetical protein
MIVPAFPALLRSSGLELLSNTIPVLCPVEPDKIADDLIFERSKRLSINGSVIP